MSYSKQKDIPEKTLLRLLAALQFTHIVDFMIIMPLGPKLMRDLNVTPGQFGMLVSAYTVAAGIAGFFSSFWIDRFSRKLALLVSYAGFIAGTILCSLSTSFFMLIFARGLAGIFGGILAGMIITIIGDAIPAQRRGKAMGTIMSAFSLAAIVGVPLGLKAADWLGWNFSFELVSGLSLFFWILCFRLLPPLKDHLKVKTTNENPLAKIRDLVKTSNLHYAIFYMVILMFGQFSVIPYISPVLVQNAHLPENKLFLMYFIGGSVTVISSPLIGKLADAWGKPSTFVLLTILSCTAIYLITNVQPMPLFILFSITAWFFITISGRIIPSMAMITEMVPPQKRGNFMGIVGASRQLASGLAAFIASRIVSKTPQGMISHYHIVGYIAILASLLALLFLKKLKPAQLAPIEEAIGYDILQED
ncbi:MAG: MFS transporter [Candidatus Hydrogenedentota bacterium]|nr:MAG: MFS transporter [Candidatus Hydrogenedentota bacterium]